MTPEEKLIEKAKWAVLLFDQANTNNALVERMGSRGEKLKAAIDDMRAAIMACGYDPYDTDDPGEWTIGYGGK